MKLFKRRDFVLLIFLILAPMLVFYSTKTYTSITGAVIYSEDVIPDVEQLALNHPLTRLAAPGSKMCVIIDDAADHVSFNIDKNGVDDFNITEASYQYCDTAENEDFILEFLDINSFRNQVNDNSCNAFKKGWGGSDYYFLISRFVEKGGAIICNEEFEEMYCGAVNYCYTDDEVEAYGLGCCSDHFITDEEADIYDSLLSEGISQGTTVDRPEIRKQEETVQPQTPATSPYQAEPSMIASGSLMIWVILPVIIIVLAGGIFAALKLHKPKTPAVNPQIQQLQNYIMATLQTGYPSDQLYYYLLQQGWSKSILDHVFQNIYKRQ